MPDRPHTVNHEVDQCLFPGGAWCQPIRVHEPAKKGDDRVREICRRCVNLSEVDVEVEVDAGLADYAWLDAQ